MPAAPASTIPAVKAYLYDGIRARVELAADLAAETLIVTYDDPGPFQPQDIVAVADVERDISVMQMVGSGGAGWLDEKYVQTVLVDVYRGDDDPKTVFERACVLADIVIDVVRQDPSLGGLVIQANPVSCTYESEWATEEVTDDSGAVTLLYVGRATRATVQILVHARN